MLPISSYRIIVLTNHPWDGRIRINDLDVEQQRKHNSPSKQMNEKKKKTL